MVNSAEQTALNAERTFVNRPGMCLQVVRGWAGVGPKYPTAATAALHANIHHGDRDVPRGAFAWWVGGSGGAGHVADSLGRGRFRSTDANGEGHCATRVLAWFDVNWPSLRYVGWSWDINDVTIPHPEEPEMNAEEWIRLREIVREESAKAVSDNNDNLVDGVWGKMITVTKPDGAETNKSTKQVIRETWQRIAKKG